MIYSLPATAFEATVDGAATGLTGTIGVRILNTPGSTIITARTTAGIVENPAGSGIYSVSLTSPSTVGEYSVIWDTGGGTPVYTSEDLLVVGNLADVVAPPASSTGLSLSTIRTEVQARGFTYVPATRIDRLVNYCYHDTNHRFPWPFLEATTSGTAPFLISDFGHGLSVVDITADAPLAWEDIRTLREWDPGLDSTGSPECWYMDGSNLKVYPASTHSISVRYIQVPADLTADSHVPLWPSRFHYNLVEGVVSRLYKDDDEPDLAADARSEYEGGIVAMQNELLVPNYDGPASIAPSPWGGSSDW